MLWVPKDNQIDQVVRNENNKVLAPKLTVVVGLGVM